MTMKRFLIPLMLLTLALSAFADDDAVDPKKIYDKLDPSIYQRRGIDVEPTVWHTETGVVFSESTIVVTNSSAVLIATNMEDLLRLMQINQERTGQGKAPIPIQLTPQCEKEFATGTLHTAESNDALSSIHLDGVQLADVAELYGDITGKKVVVDNGISARLSLEAKRVTHPQAAAAIEKALSDAGLVITPVGTNTVRISRKEKNT
ncbi:MAG: hypothetical protein WCN95_11365 [bacterium]